MNFQLVLDILVAGLLIITIAYFVVVNRRLRVLRENKEDLQKLTAAFGEATLRADQSIGRLKATAEELSSGIEKAQSLRDDLAFLIERGGSAADRLEAGVRAARKHTAAETADPAPRQPERKPKAEPKKEPVRTDTEAERELLNALRSAR